MNMFATSVDTRVFKRMVHLFDAKRRVLPPDVLEGFAWQVASRVADTVATRVPADRARISPERVDTFCDLPLRRDCWARTGKTTG